MERILALMFITFFLQLLYPNITQLLYLDPNKVSEVWRFVTNIFVHGSLSHLFFNAFTLAMFAPYLERSVGKREFYTVFFASGVAASLLYLFGCYMHIIRPAPALGASGAIYGVLGALAALAPNATILLFGFIPMRLRDAVVVWAITEFLLMFQSDGIAHLAHLGGLIYGFIYMSVR
jgi:membrane associated rhomboid family serine protease